jgi:hypothetical protein
MKTIRRQHLIAAALVSALECQTTINQRKKTRMKGKHTLNLLSTALGAGLALTTVRAADITPAEARAIAKETYIYGFPMVDAYRIEYTYFVDTTNAEYKAPWNQIKNIPRVYTPADTAIQTPNSDTPYSFAGLDLRAEPISLLTPTPSTLPTSAAAPLATVAAASSSPGQIGRARRPVASRK